MTCAKLVSDCNDMNAFANFSEPIILNYYSYYALTNLGDISYNENAKSIEASKEFIIKVSANAEIFKPSEFSPNAGRNLERACTLEITSVAKNALDSVVNKFTKVDFDLIKQFYSISSLLDKHKKTTYELDTELTVKSGIILIETKGRFDDNEKLGSPLSVTFRID